MYFTYIFPWSVLINGNYLGQNRKSGNVILIVNTPIKKVGGGGLVENFKFVEMVVHAYVYVWLYGKYCLVFLNWKYIRNIHFMGEKPCISSLIWWATNTSANLRTSEKFRLCVGPKGKIELPLNLSRQGVA